MGYGFNNNSQYELWSSVFDYSTIEELNELEKMPIPSEIETVIETNDINNVDNDFNIFKSYMQTIDITKNITDIINEFPLDLIKVFKNVFRTLKSKNSLAYDFIEGENKLYLSSTNNTEENKIYVDLFLKIINLYNLDDSYLTKDKSIGNSIVSKIKTIISSPVNQLLATEPIKTKELHDAAAYSKEQLGYEESEFMSWDVISMFEQQRNASVGKDDVGIGANGLKVFFSISNYYNSWYSELNKYPEKLNNLNIITDNKSFKKDFTINNKRRIIHSFANTAIYEKIYNKILKDYNYDELLLEYTKLSTNKAAFTASSFVSGATDNSKELVMDKINAIVELASMHLYLISLGYNMKDISLYMNSNLGKYISENISGNLFKSNKVLTVNMLIDSYKLANSKKENIDIEVNQFKDIYEGAQEFKMLASILKVNQKTAANVRELNNFLSNIESGMYYRENSVLGDKVSYLRNPKNWYLNFNINGKETTLIDKIINSNLNLSSNKEIARNYVIQVLEKAYDKGIIGGQFDVNKYLNDQDFEYKEVTKEYYNLFKNTINIFDIIDNSSHFNAMVSGVSITHNDLNIISGKYRTIFSKFKEVLRNNMDWLTIRNDNITNKYGNKAFLPNIDDRIVNKLITVYDKFLISNWLKTKSTDQFRFSVKKLLSIANIDSILLYTNNESMTESVGNILEKSKSNKTTKNTITVFNNDNSEDFIIDLKSNYGIANFKIIMESIILKILQKSNKSQLGNNLKLSSVKNFYGKFSNQITSLFGISSLNSPINMEKFQELLSIFNEVDYTIEDNLKIKNSENKILKYRDLLYLYNLVVNNESYGDKRLTPLFEDYIQDENNISYDYMNYYIDTDLEEIDIFDIPSIVETGEDINTYNFLKNKLEQSMLFSVFNNNGSFNFREGSIEIQNSNFPILTELEISDKQSERYTTAYSILSILKNRNLIINFNCD